VIEKIKKLKKNNKRIKWNKSYRGVTWGTMEFGFDSSIYRLKNIKWNKKISDNCYV